MIKLIKIFLLFFFSKKNFNFHMTMKFSSNPDFKKRFVIHFSSDSHYFDISSSEPLIPLQYLQEKKYNISYNTYTEKLKYIE